MTFPVGTSIVTVGDSLTQGGNSASSVLIANQGDSIIHWALMETPSFKHGVYYDAAASPLFRGANFGIAGDSATDLLKRLPTVLLSAKAQNAKIAVLLIGTNTGTTDTGLSAKKERIKAIVEEMTKSGLLVILGTIFPRAVTGSGFSSTVAGSYMTTLLGTNDYIRSLAASNVLIWDAWSDLVDSQYPIGHAYYGTPLASVTTDGVHLKPVGAYLASKSLKTILQSLSGSNELWDGTWFNSNPSQAGNRITHGTMPGVAGTVGAGMTGVSPTDWSVTILTPVYVSGAISVAANAKTGGQTTSFVLTSTGLGSSTGFERCSFTPTGFKVNEGAMTNGNWVRLFFKVRVENPDGVLGAITAVNINSTTGVFGYGFNATNGLEGNEPFPIGTYDGWIVSEAVKYNTSDVFLPYLQIDSLIGTAGSVSVHVEAVLFLEEQDPATTFKYQPTCSLESHAGFYEDFFGVSGMQCMGSTAYTPATNPDGIQGSMEIVDGWLKTTIRQTDPPTATGIRSEVVLPLQALGDEAWFTWEMLIKAEDWLEHTGHIIIGQCHPKEGINASGYFDFYVRDGWLTFAIPLTEPPTEGDYSKRHFFIHPIKLDHIYKMAIHTKWVATAGEGYLEAFVDGEQVFKNWFLGTGYATDTPYFKLGLYDGPHAANFGTKAARFRNLKRYHGVGGYEEVLGVVPLPPKRLVGSI